MEAGKVLSLVIILGVVIVLHAVPAMSNPCYAVCYHDCTTDCHWYFPLCYPECAACCCMFDTCDGETCTAVRPYLWAYPASGSSILTHNCKLECESSMFAAKIFKATLYAADHVGEGEVIKEALERCNNACSEVCTKGVGAAARSA